MINNWGQLVILILINLMEIIIFYLLGCKLVNTKILPSDRQVKTITFIVLYGILIGGLAYAVETNNIDGYIFRIVGMIFMMMMLKFISRRIVTDIFLMFVISFLIVLFIQVPFWGVFSVLPLSEVHVSLLIQIFALLTALFLYFKSSLNHLFSLIERKVLLKLILFIITSIALALLFYMNYNYSIYSLFYFLILALLSLIGLSLVLIRLYYYTNKIPPKLHDVTNLMIGAHLTASSTTDIELVRKQLEECMELLRLQNKEIGQLEVKEGQERENILAFIEQKKAGRTEELEIISDINYYEEHKKIPLGIVVYMLGTLLDNAIDYTVAHKLETKPILIDLTVTNDYIKIKVSNPYEYKVTTEFRESFNNGYSTKLSHAHGKDGRGYGLSNLKKVVRKYNGIIYYGSEKQTSGNYLAIIIDIGDFSKLKDVNNDKPFKFKGNTYFLVNMK